MAYPVAPPALAQPQGANVAAAAPGGGKRRRRRGRGGGPAAPDSEAAERAQFSDACRRGHLDEARAVFGTCWPQGREPTAGEVQDWHIPLMRLMGRRGELDAARELFRSLRLSRGSPHAPACYATLLGCYAAVCATRARRGDRLMHRRGTVAQGNVDPLDEAEKLFHSAREYGFATEAVYSSLIGLYIRFGGHTREQQVGALLGECRRADGVSGYSARAAAIAAWDHRHREALERSQCAGCEGIPPDECLRRAEELYNASVQQLRQGGGNRLHGIWCDMAKPMLKLYCAAGRHRDAVRSAGELVRHCQDAKARKSAVTALVAALLRGAECAAEAGGPSARETLRANAERLERLPDADAAARVLVEAEQCAPEHESAAEFLTRVARRLAAQPDGPEERAFHPALAPLWRVRAAGDGAWAVQRLRELNGNGEPGARKSTRPLRQTLLSACARQAAADPSAAGEAAELALSQEAEAVTPQMRWTAVTLHHKRGDSERAEELAKALRPVTRSESADRAARAAQENRTQHRGGTDDGPSSPWAARRQGEPLASPSAAAGTGRPKSDEGCRCSRSESPRELFLTASAPLCLTNMISAIQCNEPRSRSSPFARGETGASGDESVSDGVLEHCDDDSQQEHRRPQPAEHEVPALQDSCASTLPEAANATPPDAALRQLRHQGSLLCNTSRGSPQPLPTQVPEAQRAGLPKHASAPT
eukprot:TRINITY_DN55242_c0_g1_i1.p1 TRINITY_DN55242_c0_g1~~TRINITY_DN55242_c0_g1_i1.p1  ORF type:complete len:747 (+),score=144.74 TRINITY_DN55242_c0_g1_i1:120-2243(+)